MAMPDKKTTRAALVARVGHLFGGDLAVLILALADAEWEREERAAELEAEQADRQLKADKENA